MKTWVPWIAAIAAVGVAVASYQTCGFWYSWGSNRTVTGEPKGTV